MKHTIFIFDKDVQLISLLGLTESLDEALRNGANDVIVVHRLVNKPVIYTQ